jgi:adenylate cyclase
MGIEIERKFLLRDDTWRQAVVRTTRIRQGYLCTESGRTVRVRTRDAEAYLTIKGARQGIARAEYEYPVPMADALEMLKLAVGTVDKLRHEVAFGGKLWEIDEFEGVNAPLYVAELELDAVDEPFERPAWLGEEVSHKPEYSSSTLALRPYSTWSV